MTDELFNEICDEIGITTDSVKSICDRKGIAYSTFWRQIQKGDEWYIPYARARRFQMELMADEIREIADDSSKDKIVVMENGVEKEKVDHEHIQRDKLRIDTRKFLMSKLASVVFGDKTTVTVNEEIKRPQWWDEIQKK